MVEQDKHGFKEILKEVFDKQQGERIAELSYFVAKVLVSQPKQKRNVILEKEIGSAKDIVTTMIQDLENKDK